jgi:hypothetical protein
VDALQSRQNSGEGPLNADSELIVSPVAYRAEFKDAAATSYSAFGGASIANLHSSPLSEKRDGLQNLLYLHKHYMLPPQTESRIWQLYAKALAAKTPEDTNLAVQELRSELDEHPFVGRRSVEVQINNLACLDRAVGTTSIACTAPLNARTRF